MNTATEVIDKLSSAINASVADPQIASKLAELGGLPFTGSPADFAALIASETEKWGKVVKFAGIKAD